VQFTWVLEVAEDDQAIIPFKKWLPLGKMEEKSAKRAFRRLFRTTFDSNHLAAVLMYLLSNPDRDHRAEPIERNEGATLTASKRY